jgi:hypothetical protein
MEGLKRTAWEKAMLSCSIEEDVFNPEETNSEPPEMKQYICKEHGEYSEATYYTAVCPKCRANEKIKVDKFKYEFKELVEKHQVKIELYKDDDYDEIELSIGNYIEYVDAYVFMKGMK